jgi:hypothetical protein
MYRALLFKELREVWWTGAIAFLVLCCVVWDQVGLDIDVLTFRLVLPSYVRVPFQSDDMESAVTAVSACLAVVLALWQTLGESVRGTWRYLRHRPIRFSRLLLTKMAAGLGVLLVSTGAPIALYLRWAMSEDLHGSPFDWQMAAPTLSAWLFAPTAYLAAYLVGIRQARWFGSRLWPLALAILLPLGHAQFGARVPGIGYITLLCDALLFGGIFYAAGEHDD